MDQLLEQEKFIKEFFGKMGWPDVTVVLKNENENECEISIGTYDAKFLIGVGGKNIDSIEHLVRVLLFKKFLLKKYIKIDINGYKKERTSNMIDFARNAAHQVSQTKKPISLPSMNSFERKMVHNELASRPDVVTESQGEGPNRHIIIKPFL